MGTPAFEIGDPVADFSLPDTDGKTVTLSDTVGIPVLLVFLGNDPAVAEVACKSLAEHKAEFDKWRTQVRAVVVPEMPLPRDLPFPVLLDGSGEIHDRYGADDVLRGVLLSPNARVARQYDGVDPAMLAAQVVADAAGLLTLESERVVMSQPPILLIPNVLPVEFRQRLMNIWETEGNIDSGFMKDVNGKTVGQYDYSAKIRRDHFLPSGGPVYAEAREFIVRRVIGEIFKTFNYRATRLEEMKIACYDASRGGYFRPHRDNTTGATAHRRFAISMLLNDDYEGGYLRFPEYGPQLYRPKAGGAAVFSGTMLHEATDVTAGRRFVLLTFLYGEQEAKVREEYARRTGGSYRAGGTP